MRDFSGSAICRKSSSLAKQNDGFLLPKNPGIWPDARHPFLLETGAAVSFTDRWQAGAFSTTVGEHLEAHGEYAFHETKERSDLSYSDGAASAARVTARNCSEGIIGCALHFEKISAIVECYLNQSAYNDEQWERIRIHCRTIAGGRSSNPLYYYNLGTAYRSFR